MKTLLVMATLLFSSLVFSQDKAAAKESALDALNYPELEVVPRATDRLEQEFRGEGSFKAYWPYYVAGIGALWAGNGQKGKYKEGEAENNYELTEAQQKTSDLTAVSVSAVGAGWIGLALYLGSRRYYAYALAETRNIKGTDKRSQLQKERIAEEAMESSALLHKKVMYLMTGLQIATTGYMISSWSTPETKNNATLSLLTAFLPLIFQHDYIYQYSKHQEYKRKIYAPLVGAAPVFNEKNALQGTQLSFVWEF
jgi:hypothetical protein